MQEVHNSRMPASRWCLLRNIAICLCLSAPGGALANDGTHGETVAALNAKAEVVKAEAELQRARNDRIAVKFAPLTALAGEGKTTLEGNAGQIESWLLASSALGDAALLIASRLSGQAETGKFIVLAADEPFDFTPLFAARQEAATVLRQLSGARAAAPDCKPRPGRGGDTAERPVRMQSPVLAAVGAAGSLLQSDTTVLGVEVAPEPRLLALALAEQLGSKAVIPTSLTLPPGAGSPFQDDLGLIETSRLEAAFSHACLAATGRSDRAALSSIARLDAALKRQAAMMTALQTAKDGADAPIVTVLKLDWLAKNTPKIVRVFVDKAGGTVITRKNIWTAFGAPAVGVSGGLIASFGATDPASGGILAAGVVACRTRLASLRSVHQADTAGSCRLIEPVRRTNPL